MTVDTQIDRDRIYDGLDAAHTPRLFVPEKYIVDGSNKLERLAARALLDSQMFPKTQFDVVWFGRTASHMLRADIQPFGTYDPEFHFGHRVEETGELLVPDIGHIQNLPGGATSFIGRIEEALKNGAGVFKPADLARRYDK
jgi:hypothetical protein